MFWWFRFRQLTLSTFRHLQLTSCSVNSSGAPELHSNHSFYGSRLTLIFTINWITLYDSRCDEKYKKSFSYRTHTFAVSYQRAALSNEEFHFINSWISPTTTHIYVMISVLEELSWSIIWNQSMDCQSAFVGTEPSRSYQHGLGDIKILFTWRWYSFSHMELETQHSMFWTLVTGFLHSLKRPHSGLLNVPEDRNNPHQFSFWVRLLCNFWKVSMERNDKCSNPSFLTIVAVNAYQYYDVK